MPQFTAGTTSWIVKIDINAIRRVRDSTGHNLAALFDDGLKLIDDLTADIVALVDVIYMAIKPQADAAGITDIQFGESLDAEIIEHAFDALLDATIAFFHPSRQPAARRILRTIRTAAKKVEQVNAVRLDEALAKLDPMEIANQILAKTDASTALESSTYATDSPELSASTPDP